MSGSPRLSEPWMKAPLAPRLASELGLALSQKEPGHWGDDDVSCATIRGMARPKGGNRGPSSSPLKRRLAGWRGGC